MTGKNLGNKELHTFFCQVEVSVTQSNQSFMMINSSFRAQRKYQVQNKHKSTQESYIWIFIPVV